MKTFFALCTSILCVSLLPSHAHAGDYLFKWKDSSGNLFVTDRLEDVPAGPREKIRAKLAAIEEARKKNPERQPAKAAPIAEPVDTRVSSYELLKQRMAREKQVKEKARTLRTKLEDLATNRAKLEEELGLLRTNPTLNIAIPARQERIHEIEKALEDQSKDKEAIFTDVRTLLIEAEKNGDPESWVTNLD